MNKFIKDQIKNEINRLSLECISMFVSAYNLAKQDKLFKQSWDEDDFTTHLVGYLEELKIKNQWFISPQMPYYTDKHYWGKIKSKKAPRPDLSFEKYTLNLPSPTFKFTIEAKNIKFDDSSLKGRYINTGIDNFKTKRYPFGCLAGYVLKGSADECSESINSLLKKRKRATEILKKQSIIYDFENAYLSSHKSTSSTIELKHIFLEFY